VLPFSLPFVLVIVAFLFTVPFGLETNHESNPHFAPHTAHFGSGSQLFPHRGYRAGNWGTSLVAGLLAAGVGVDEVVVRRMPARRARGLPLTLLEEASLDANTIWLCVPDGVIAEASAQLVKRFRALGRTLDGRNILHSSGALTVEALAAAAAAGAQVAGVAPLMTFPTRRPVALAGVPFAVESSPQLRRKLFGLVRLLGGEPFRIDSPSKILYHAAAVMASPLLLSGLVAAQQTAMLAGLSRAHARRLLAPMAASTIENFAARGPEMSFSGPIARGDIDTMELHLRALSEHPILVEAYRSLARNALEYLPAPRREEMVRMLDRAACAQKN
jgi:predicted short-subunit dehydrogenase-like oxidoreductase (DUF2520 family)